MKAGGVTYIYMVCYNNININSDKYRIRGGVERATIIIIVDVSNNIFQKVPDIGVHLTESRRKRKEQPKSSGGSHKDSTRK